MTSPFHHEPRKRFTPQERARVFASRGGRCHRCARKLTPADRWTLEHVIALENGGTNDLDNMSCTCEWCRPEKDAEDHGRAARGRRSFTKHNVPSEFRRSLSWGRRGSE